jgi:hypothetical protein
MTTKEQLLEEIEALTAEQQEELLFAAQVLRARTSLPQTTPGHILVERLDEFAVSMEDADAVELVVTEKLRQVNPDDWR